MQQQILSRLDRIESILADQETAEAKPLTLQEAADFLDISPSYLYKLTSTQRIPHFKPHGKRLYFLKSDLRDYLLQNRVKPQEEIERDAATHVTLNP